MRLALLVFLILAAGAGASAPAAETANRTFSGVKAITTPVFAMPDRWTLSWEATTAVNLTLLTPDGTLVTGLVGSAQGSLFEPSGGSFYLQITPVAAGANWQVSVSPLETTASTNSPTAYMPPAIICPPGMQDTGPLSAGKIPPAADPLFNKILGDLSKPVAPVDSLSATQARAVVVIKGDLAEGTGFLVHTPDGPAVLTNLHVIAANPNVKIWTQTGTPIQTLSLKGASDRDLAMFLIRDDHYSYLDLDTDIKDTVASGDEVITPGNSEGGEVVLATPGTVLGLGADRIEISNPIFHGNSGGPVFHTKSGKVLGVVTEAMKVRTDDVVDKASFENKDSAITGGMRYFALRIDTVPLWQVYDWPRYLSETTFLKEFHDTSRCLDSYMNGAQYEKAQVATAIAEDGPPNADYYQRNLKLQAAHSSYHSLAEDADDSQKLDATRELTSDLEGVADTDMATIQNPANFYSFDQLRAQKEIKYRQALRTEIDKYAERLGDMGH